MSQINYEDMYRALLRKHKALVEKTRVMRNLQKKYFRSRAVADLEGAKLYEKDVDKLLAEEYGGEPQSLFPPKEEGG